MTALLTPIGSTVLPDDHGGGKHTHLIRGLDPIDYAENARWRRTLLDRRDLIPGLMHMSHADPVFWLGAFGWIFEPRRKSGHMREIPFIPWKFQGGLINRFQRAINSHDVLVAKTRDMGVSWLAIALFLHQWLYEPGTLLLLVSRNEAYVDEKGNPKSLFWKLDFLLERLPSWMVPRFKRKKLQLHNLDNGSVIDGESTTGDVARGDRRVAILLDEFAAVEALKQASVLASTSQSTYCRLIVSTFGEEADSFEAKARDGSCEVHKVGWWNHPTKSIGMIKKQDGTLWSPWYAEQCRRIGDPRQIARELDCDSQASASRYFDPLTVKAHERAHSCPPFESGVLVHDPISAHPIRFENQPEGTIRLWVRRNGAGVPAIEGRLAVGVDIAEGTGATPSILSMVVVETGAKVLEYASANIRPEAFAALTVALLKWMEQDRIAILCPEAPGPGRTYIARLHELGFHRIWREAGGQNDGFYPNKDTRREIYSHLQRSIADGSFQNKSMQALSEYGDVVYRPDGWIVHRQSYSINDPSGARNSHADRVTADALALLARRDAPAYAAEKVVVPGSFGERYRDRERARKVAATEALDGAVTMADLL